MTARRLAGLSLALVMLGAGCASAAGHPTAAARPPAALSLTTSLTTSTVAWAAVPMGAPSGPNLFWQLFQLPASGTRWALVTPPDVPTNGAIVLASPGGQALVTGIRPSLRLAFSPITSTSDGGKNWTSSPPDPGLADVPDALAIDPAGQLLALGEDGQADLSTRGGAGWATLASAHTLAATAAGRSCGLTALSAAALTPAGVPLLAGGCAHPDVVGIFARRNGTWYAAGPAVPPSLAGQHEQVLRLTRTGTNNIALLQAGEEPHAFLVVGWTPDGDQHWTLSPPLALNGSRVLSAAFGLGGAMALVLSSGRGLTVAGPGAQWRSLPALPAGRTVTLAFPPSGGLDALAADGSKFTVWRLAPSQARWTEAQAMTVPIQYGSSG